MNPTFESLFGLQFCHHNCGAYIGFSENELSEDRQSFKPLEVKTGKIHDCPKEGWSKQKNCFQCHEKIIFHNSHKNIDGKRYPKATLYAPSRPNMEKWERELTSNPFQKPETLCRKLIRGFTNEGDIVFDPFAGSGSILASAYKEGRESTGFEIDSVFYSQATKRLENLTLQGTLW